MQVAQVFRALQSHHHQITAEAEMLVDQVRELLLRCNEALDLVFAPRGRRFFVLRDGGRAEALGDQTGALERSERARIDAQ